MFLLKQQQPPNKSKKDPVSAASNTVSQQLTPQHQLQGQINSNSTYMTSTPVQKGPTSVLKDTTLPSSQRRGQHATQATKRHRKMTDKDRDKDGSVRLLDDQDDDDDFTDTGDDAPFLESQFPDVPPLPSMSTGTKLKYVVFGIIATLVIILFAMLVHSGWLGPMFLHVLEFVHKLGYAGPIVLLLLITVLIPTLIPTTPLNIGAGFLFGWVGLPVISTAALLGASISFWISRRLYAEAAERRLHNVKMYHTLNILLAEDRGKFSWKSLKVILLTRASPLFPFPLINYACGLTRVGYSSYALGTLIGMVPWHIIDIYIGYELTSLQQIEEGHSTTYVLAVIGFTIVLTIFVTVIARRMLRSMEASTRLQKARIEEAGNDDADSLEGSVNNDVDMQIINSEVL